MIMISGSQVGVEGVAARAVFEANQSGISEKKLSVPQEARQRTYAPSRAQEYCTRNQLKNMITLKSVDPEIIKISTKQTYGSVLIMSTSKLHQDLKHTRDLSQYIPY